MPVDTVGQRVDAGNQRTDIIAFGVGRVCRCFNDLLDLLHDIGEGGVYLFFRFLAERGQLPAAVFISAKNGVLQDSRHCRIHRPANVENLDKPVDVLQHMNSLREAERIDSQQLGVMGVGTQYTDIIVQTEDVLVFSLGRLDDQEWNVCIYRLIQNLVDSVALARTRTASNKGMCRKGILC